MKEKIKLTANILFSGIGCQERGIENTDLFDLEVLNTSDINKDSVLSYAAVHCGLANELVETYENYPSREEMAQYLTDINLGYVPEKDKPFDWFKLIKKKTKEIEKYWLACKLSNNLGDISKIEELPYADFWTCSFPCTDISVAGKMKGLNPDSGTRSSLLWDNIRLLQKAKETKTLPKYIMFENVKNLVGKKFIQDFNNLLDILDEIGFNSYWSVINSKDCGIPQNRERVFVISIRKDIDKKQFVFPKPFNIGIRLKDILEEVVADNYYLSEEATAKFRYKETNKDIKQIGWLKKSKHGTEHQSNMVYSADGYARALTACDYKDPLKIMVKQVGQIYGTEKEPNPQAGRIYDENGLSPTLDSCSGGNRMPKILENNERIRIRKLTPRECWKLMGLTFEDCDKARSIGVADTNLYKQAGNGIVTNCVELLAEHVYKAQYDDTYICTDEKIQKVISETSTNKTLCLNSKGGRNGIDGLQPSLKDRIYDSNGIATACTTSQFFMPNYLVNENFMYPPTD